MQRRTVIITLLLILSGGAIVNIAVAWTISQRAGPIVYSADRIPRMGEYFWAEDNATWRVTYLNEVGMAYIRASRRQEGFESSGRESFVEDELPRWSGFRYGRTPADAKIRPQWREYARGWPMLAMYMRMEEDTTVYEHVAYQAINVPFRSANQGRWQRRPEEYLPVGIIWPGFAINTLFYAAILGGLLGTCYGWFALRRHLRRRRGLCETCAYPVGVSPVCTECGAAVRTPVARSS